MGQTKRFAAGAAWTAVHFIAPFAGPLLGVLTAIASSSVRVAGAVAGLAIRLFGPLFNVLRIGAKAWILQIAIVTCLFAVAVLWGYTNAGRITHDFHDASDRAVSPVLRDSTGRFVGIYGAVPKANDDGFAAYSSVWSAQSPSLGWACLKHLEDRRAGSWFVRIPGIDLISVAKTVLGLAIGRGGSHSTLPQQVSRVMRGEAAGRDEAPLQKLGRKFTEWADSPALNWDNPDASRFITANLPLLAGASGSRAGALPRGTEAASLIVFGHSTAKLNPAENFVLAAADWRPVLLAPDSDAKGLERVDARWNLLKQRAARCLPLVGPADSDDFKAAARQLSTLPAPRLHDAGFKSKADVTNGFATAVNPVRRARAYLGDGGLALVGHELSASSGVSPWRGKIAAAQLTIDADKSRQFDRKIENKLGDLQRRLGQRLRLPLIGEDAAVAHAQVVVAVADLDGRIVAYFESGPIGAFTAPRPVASLGKALVAAPVLGRTDSADTLYCNRQLATVRNPGAVEGATSCRKVRAFVPARAAFARSLNDAVINRLTKVSPVEIRSTAEALGFELPRDVPPATAVPLGLFEATPEQMMRGMAAIARVIANAPGNAPLPYLISTVGVVDQDGSVQEQPALRGDALPWVKTAPILTPASLFMRSVLTAPFDAGGTLARLGAYRAERNPALRFHIAKTGTSTVASGLTRDAMILGALQRRDGLTQVYFVLVGTSDPKRPLGSVNGGSFAELAKLAIDEILQGGNP